MKKKMFLFVFLTAMLTILFGSVTVRAAQKNIERIVSGVTYSKYDVTGDSKPDKVLIKRTCFYKGNLMANGRYDIYVNGKISYSTVCKFVGYGEAYICKYGKKTYIILQLYNPNVDIPYSCRILFYNKGKLSIAADILKDLSYPYSLKCVPVSVTSRYIKFRCEIHPDGIGYSRFYMTYYTSGSKAKIKSKNIAFAYNYTHKYRGKTDVWYAQKSFEVYTGVNSSKVAFRVQWGSKCKVERIYFGSDMWIKITCGQKSGWRKTGYGTTKLFYGVYF